MRRLLLLSTALIALTPAAFAQSPDLFVQKSGPSSVTAGSDVPFSVTISNVGALPATSVQLTDPLPAGMTFVSVTQNNGPAFNCSSTPPIGSNGTITCTIATFNSGASANFTLVGNIPSGTAAGTQFMNTATGSSTPPDANAGNNSQTATVTVAASTDLFVTKDGPISAPADSDVTFTISAGNNGPDSGTISLTDTLPGTMTFVSITKTSGPSFPCPTQPTPGSGGTINCTTTLAPGTSATFSLITHIPPGTPPGTTFNNNATVTGSGVDPNSENDTASAGVTVPIPQADLSVQKTGPPDALPNSDVAFTINVNNAGPIAAASVSLTDTLPGTMTFVSINQNSGPTFDCSSHPAVGSGGTITCTIDPLPPGASASFTLVGHIPSGTSGQTFINTANVTSSTADLNPDNNSSQSAVDVASANLAVNKSGPPTATAGGPIAWTITASNGGPDPADNVSLTDPLPAGTTFVSINQNNGPPASCGGPPVGTNGTVTCTWGTLNNLDSAQFTLTANINPSFTGTLNNTASISATTADPITGNNSSLASTTVSASADLTINKSGPTTANAGSNITYTIMLTNGGPSTAVNVALNDAVPANTTFVSESQTGGPTFSCTTPAAGGTGNVNCTLASFPPGTATFSIIVKIDPAATGATITNTATATSSTPDPNPNGNTPTATTTVTRSADISVLKTAPASAVAGTTITYNITVKNNGPSDSATVTMADTLPPNTTFVSESQPTGPSFICTNPPVGGTGAVSCTIASMVANATATFSIVVQVAAAAPTGPSNNTATVTSAFDPTPGNNSSLAVTQVGNLPVDLTITKSPSPGPYGTGGTVTYTIGVKNNGPNAATGVTVTDTLPAGTTYQSSTPAGACSGTTTITCNGGTIANGGTATFTLTVTLPSTPGPITNSATVTAAAQNPDTNPSDNTATTTITVIPASNIAAISPLALLLLGIALAAAGALVLKR